MGLEKNFSYVLFPFRFDRELLKGEGFNSPLTKQNGKQAPMWRPVSPRQYHLKENLAAMLGTEGDQGSAGRLYSLDDSLRRELALPELRDRLLFHRRGGDRPYSLCLEQVELCLFFTGLGFLNMRFSAETESAEELLDINYYLCEVKSGENRLSFEKRLGRDERQTIDFRLLDAVRRLCAGFAGAEDLDCRPGLNYIDNKPLIFSYLLFEDFPAELGRLLFNLRTNFKASYKVSEEQYELGRAQGLLHPFENLYWGASLNGAVCCASLTGDRQTDEFFRNTFPSNLRDTYYILFLLRQHQRFAVQDFQRLFVQADRAVSLSGEDIGDAYRAVMELRRRVASFKLRCLYRDPSSVEHINQWDAFIQGTGNIRENIQALEESVAQLDAVAQAMREEIQARNSRRERRAGLRRERALYIVTALWSSIVFLESAWQISEHLRGGAISIPSLWTLLPLGLTVLPIMTLAAELKQKRRELDELQKQEEEKEKDR